MTNTQKQASNLSVGDVLPHLGVNQTGTGTVVKIVARTAKTITVLVEYDEAARRENGNQAKRTNRHSLATMIDVTE